MPPAALAPRRRAGGFTLIELLVVMVIIGVLVSVAMLSFGALGQDREVEDEAGQLAQVAALAMEQAQLESRDYGLLFSREGWDVRVLDGRTGSWQPVPDDRLLGAHDLPEGLEHRLLLEGRPIQLKRREQLDEPKPDEPAVDLKPLDSDTTRLTAGAVPQVIAFGSGEWQPFRWSVLRPAGGGTPERLLTVEGLPDGTVQVLDADGKPWPPPPDAPAPGASGSAR